MRKITIFAAIRLYLCSEILPDEKVASDIIFYLSFFGCFCSASLFTMFYLHKNSFPTWRKTRPGNELRHSLFNVRASCYRGFYRHSLVETGEGNYGRGRIIKPI
jgi:hypothetical protein